MNSQIIFGWSQSYKIKLVMRITLICEPQESRIERSVINTFSKYKCLFTQFFPQTIRDWNELPDSLISSAELSDDCVSKFTSLVRARD